MSDFADGIAACVRIAQNCAALERANGRDGVAKAFLDAIRLFEAREQQEETPTRPPCPHCGR